VPVRGCSPWPPVSPCQASGSNRALHTCRPRLTWHKAKHSTGCAGRFNLEPRVAATEKSHCICSWACWRHSQEMDAEAQELRLAMAQSLAEAEVEKQRAKVSGGGQWFRGALQICEQADHLSSLIPTQGSFVGWGGRPCRPKQLRDGKPAPWVPPSWDHITIAYPGAPRCLHTLNVACLPSRGIALC
jgi:hypothetical protein